MMAQSIKKLGYDFIEEKFLMEFEISEILLRKF
jgi:hypothetical protein